MSGFKIVGCPFGHPIVNKTVGAFFLFLLVLSSCQKRMKNDSESLQTRSYNCITVKAAEGGKTHLDLIGKAITWKDGDQIMVQDRNNLENMAVFTLDPSCDGSSTGEFRICDDSGKVDENASITGSEFNLFYLNRREQPILNREKEGAVSVLSDQIYVEDGIEDNILPMTAYSSNLNDVTLKCQASILSINLKNNEASTKTLQSIELSSEDYLSGNIFVDLKNNLRECNTAEYENWISGEQTLVQKKYVNLSFGDGLALASGQTKRINIAVARNTYKSLKYSITYTENGETRKCVLSSSKREIHTDGGETILLGTQEIVRSFENLYFIVDGIERSEKEFQRLNLAGGERVAVRSHRKSESGEEEVLTQQETSAALDYIGAKKKKVSIDFSNVEAGFTTIELGIFTAVKNYMKDFHFPKDVLTIKTFKEFGAMGDVYLNDGLKTINGGGPGFYTQVMETIHIPASVTSIGTANFDHASGIVVAEGNPNYWADGVALYTLKEIDGKKVPYMLSSICGRVDLSSTGGVYEIPETVVGHLQYAQDFASNIKTLVVPEGFKTISSYHLRDCRNLSCIRFKSTTSLFAWTLSSAMPKNGSIEILMPEGSTNEEIRASLSSYYGNYQSWVNAGWVIKAVSPNGEVLKTLTSGNIENLNVVKEDESLF